MASPSDRRAAPRGPIRLRVDYERMNAFFAQAEKVQHLSSHTPIRYSQNGQIGTTTLPLTVPGWDVTTNQGTQLIDAAQSNDGNGLEIKLGGDPINRAESQSSPEGVGFFGAAIVLLPVIIWLWATRDITTALLLTLFLGIVGVLDNILKPLVMGRGLTTPTLVIFIGVIGGTLAHGIVGLFIGPVILSVAWELMEAWIRNDRVGPSSSRE